MPLPSPIRHQVHHGRPRTLGLAASLTRQYGGIQLQEQHFTMLVLSPRRMLADTLQHPRMTLFMIQGQHHIETLKHKPLGCQQTAPHTSIPCLPTSGYQLQLSSPGSSPVH